jgi:PAS domain S-box-containing protein
VASDDSRTLPRLAPATGSWRSRRVAQLAQARRGGGAFVTGPWLEAADFTLDAGGHIVSWSATAQRSYGYSSDEVLGRHLSILYDDENLEDADRLLQAAHEQGHCTELVERLRRDRAPVALQARLVAFTGPSPTAAGFAELDIPLLQEGSRGALAADRLIKLAAHELRAPLSVVLGALTLLDLQLQDGREPEYPGRVAEILTLARDELRQMDDLLASILDSWRTHKAALDVHMDRCDLRDVVEAGLQTALLGRERITVDMPAGPLPLVGDPARLRQVVRNLVSNAFKYSPPGSPVALRVEERADRLRIAVEDQGVGIDETDLELIFERHYRGRIQPETDPGGLGIGLYVCRTIVEQHGGRIWAECPEGPGARVCFELPRIGPDASP